LLRDSSLPVIDIAYAAGFGSVRRLHTLFQKHYGVAPATWRRSHNADELKSDAIAIELAYRPPYAWQAQLDFLAGRAIAGVEAVIDNRYVRSVRLHRDGKTFSGWISVEHAESRLSSTVRNSVIVRVSASLTPVIAAICAKVRHLFDLNCDPQAIADALGPLAAAEPGLRVPGAFDGFEMAVRAILGQQISVAAARTLAGRIAAKFGTPLTTPNAAPFPEITYSFPSADEWPQDEAAFIGLGITGNRVRALAALARRCAEGTLILEPTADIERALIELQALPGVGEWTAHYIAMRALAWPDAFLHTDYGVKKALGETNPRRVLAIAEPWRPWRAYATRHLWHSLSRMEPIA